MRGPERWTYLCCQRREGLEGSGPVGRDLTLADHVGGRDAGDGRSDRVESLEAHRRAGDPLDETMVLLKEIVQIFDLSDLDCAATAGKFQDGTVALVDQGRMDADIGDRDYAATGSNSPSMKGPFKTVGSGDLEQWWCRADKSRNVARDRLLWHFIFRSVRQISVQH